MLDELFQTLEPSLFGDNFIKSVRAGRFDFLSLEFKKMDGLEQPPQWHPEGDVLTHTQRVINSIVFLFEVMRRGKVLELYMGAERIITLYHLMVFTAMFHDIGKPSTVRKHPKLGDNCFFGHAEVGAKLAEKALAQYLDERQASALSWAIENHMRMHVFDDVRECKQKKLSEDPRFFILGILHLADRMGATLDYHSPEKKEPLIFGQQS